MAELGNPLKVLKKLGSGQNIRHGRATWNTHFLKILSPEYFVFSNKCVLCKTIYLIHI